MIVVLAFHSVRMADTSMAITAATSTQPVITSMSDSGSPIQGRGIHRLSTIAATTAAR